MSQQRPQNPSQSRPPSVAPGANDQSRPQSPNPPSRAQSPSPPSPSPKSRPASAVRGPSPSPVPHSKSRSRSIQNRDVPSAYSSSDAEEDSIKPRHRPSKKPRKRQVTRHVNNGGLGLPGIDDMEDVGKPSASPVAQKDDNLKLRLDINLDVAVELRAKVHGDVTLSLLQ